MNLVALESKPPKDPYYGSSHVVQPDIPKPVEGRADEDGQRPRLAAFDQLLYESDVTAPIGGKLRLVDNRHPPVDFARWCKLLAFRIRLDGHHGAWDIFEGLRSRNIDLPVEGQDAERLWDAIVPASFTLNTSASLLSYAQDLYTRTGRQYENLYALVVGHYLPNDKMNALLSHGRLKALGLPKPGSLRTLILNSEMTVQGATTLKHIYKDFRDTGIYDVLITRLCARRQYGDAVFWHFRLMEEQDHPSSMEVVEPLRQFLSLTGRYGVLESVNETLRRVFKDYRYSDSRRNNSYAYSEAESSQPAPSSVRPLSSGGIVSDQFCARAFATKAFNPGFVIRSLKAFSVRSIGPLALRELGLRCRSLLKSFKADTSDPFAALAQEMAVQLDQLKAANIEIAPCKFTALVLKLVRDGQGVLLDAVLSSDQHPDVYEDEDLQVRLLQFHLAAGDMAQVHHALAVLTIGHQNLACQGWNSLLQAHLGSKTPDRLSSASRVLSMMRRLQVPVSVKTMRMSYFDLLNPPKPGKRVSHNPEATQKLHFVSRMWLDGLTSGLNVPASSWNGIIRHYGRRGLYSDLERLALWLAYHYSNRAKYVANSAYRRRTVRQLNLVFPPMMQRAIVEWYFQSLQYPALALAPAPRIISNGDAQTLGLSTLSRSELPPVIADAPLYLRGLALLRVLHRYGLRVDSSDVRRAVSQRLVILFGDGVSAKKANRVAARENPHRLQTVVKAVQEIWRPVGTLFHIPASLLVESKAADHDRRAENMLKRAIFGEAKVVRRMRDLDPQMRLVKRYRRPSRSRRRALMEFEGAAGSAAGDMLETPAISISMKNPPERMAL